MTEEICDGVKILVERMKTNPEEFAEEFGKWRGFVNPPWEEHITNWVTTLHPIEIEMLEEARRNLLREKFTAEVMKKLLEVKEVPTTFKATPYTQSLTVATNGTGGVGGAGVWVGATPIIDDQMMELKKAWEKYKNEYKKENKK